MRVLVIEDETRLAATLQDLLELNGYTADVCHDGEAGLDNALTDIYDVIVLDVMLPKLDGFTVLRRLREAGNATPVLMLTARSEVSDKVEGLDRGADYYLTKPFDPKELLACVRALTRRQPELRNTDLLEFGGVKLDKSSFTLFVGTRMPDQSGRYVRLGEEGAIYALPTDSIDAVMSMSVNGMRAAPAEDSTEGTEQ